MNKTAANLRALMLAWDDMSDNALSEATGVPQPTISRILTGKSEDPRDSTLRPLAEFFGLSLNQLKATPTGKVVALARGHVEPERVTPDEAPADETQDRLQLFAAVAALMKWIAETRPAEAPFLRAGLEQAADGLAAAGSARNRLDSLIAALPAQLPSRLPLRSAQ
jgi:transcriptional regulator with XRE-family HTH domain